MAVEKYNGAFTGPEIDERLRQVPNKLNKPVLPGREGQALILDGSGNTYWGDFPMPSVYTYIRYSARNPISDADIKTTPDAWMGFCVTTKSEAPTSYLAYSWYLSESEKATSDEVQAIIDDYSDN